MFGKTYFYIVINIINILCKIFKTDYCDVSFGKVCQCNNPNLYTSCCQNVSMHYVSNCASPRPPFPVLANYVMSLNDH